MSRSCHKAEDGLDTWQATMDSGGRIRDAHGDGGGHNVIALHSQLLAVEAMRIGEHEFAQGKKVRIELSSDGAILAETLTVAATRPQEARAGHPSGNAEVEVFEDTETMRALGTGIGPNLKNRNDTLRSRVTLVATEEFRPHMTLTRPWMICVRRLQEAGLSMEH